MKSRLGVVSACMLVVATLTGCATASRSDDMVPQQITVAHTSSDTVSIAVSGGKETSKMGASQISNDAFAQALRDSITKFSLFKSVADSGARYKLTAFIGKVDQPMIGLSLTVKMEVSYSLVDTSTGRTVWTKDVANEHAARTSEAFAAVKRLQLANEGAARDNIAQALADLSGTSLD